MVYGVQCVEDNPRYTWHVFFFANESCVDFRGHKQPSHHSFKSQLWIWRRIASLQVPRSNSCRSFISACAVASQSTCTIPFVAAKVSIFSFNKCKATRISTKSMKGHSMCEGRKLAPRGAHGWGMKKKTETIRVRTWRAIIEHIKKWSDESLWIYNACGKCLTNIVSQDNFLSKCQFLIVEQRRAVLECDVVLHRWTQQLQYNCRFIESFESSRWSEFVPKSC